MMMVVVVVVVVMVVMTMRYVDMITSDGRQLDDGPRDDDESLCKKRTASLIVVFRSKSCRVLVFELVNKCK